MDALALLSEEEGDDDEEPEEEEEDDGPDSAQAAPATIKFDELKKAGFTGNGSLSDTEMYRRLGGAEAPKAGAGGAEGASGGGTAEAPGTVSARARLSVPPPSDAELQKQADQERKDIMLKAQARDKKRAGVGEKETNRQKNARKAKMGQANFSLKDDRDCVNPFVDHSNDSHVKGYTGKRVDKRASVKQISNLDYTS
mmetsp:Transcript_9021/g.23360  ORF Transcript_9021/g.23360 Transcript_9021/m.23360 type:complete len:198 (-) Transcript_9021:99-692(-)